MKEKKKVILISAFWMILAFIGGGKFIKNNYNIGMLNEYCQQIEPDKQILWAIIAYICASIIIVCATSFIIKAIKNNGKERRILFYSLPVFCVLLSCLFADLAPSVIKDYYVGDEKNIWDAAVRLYPFFFVYMSELYLICFFVLPLAIAPSIIKIIFCSLVMGYTVYRVKEYYKTNLSFLIYIVCLLKPFLELGIRVHRMQWYGLLYLFFAVKIYFDEKNKEKNFSGLVVFGVSMVVSLLTVLRREGLYLFILGAFLIVVTYVISSSENNKKNIIKAIIIFFFCEGILYYPAIKNGFGESSITYRSYIVHMLGEQSLNREKIANELEIINQYMDIDKIDKYNQDLGISAYDDAMYSWPWWKDGNYYVIKDEKKEFTGEFRNVVFKIIEKEPLTFVRSRVKSFFAAARGKEGYNLFLPLLLLLMLAIYTAYKKNKVLFFLCLGILVHIGITTLTMPASYFKYFYEMYLFSYVFFIIMVIEERLKIVRDIK